MGKLINNKTFYALFCLTFGLTTIGVWTDVVGYSINLLSSDSPLNQGVFNGDAFLWGRFFVGLILIIFARHIPRIQTTLSVSIALIMSAATASLVLSYHQLLIDPYLLSSVSIFLTGGGYIFLAGIFYILFAQRIKISYIVVCIAISLVLETVFSVLISLYCQPGIQALIVIVAPLLAVICYFIGEHFSRDLVSEVLPQKAKGAAKTMLLALIVVFSTLLVLIRAMSKIGIWGSSRENFLGMTELSVLELVIISSVVLLLAYLVFILPQKRFSLQIRCLIAFIVLLAGLQLLAFTNDYQLPYIFNSLTAAISLFAHLAFWMMTITCIQETDSPPFRIVSIARPFYAISSLAWTNFFEKQAFITSSFVMIVIYVLLIAVLLMVFNGRIMEIFSSRGTQQLRSQQHELFKKMYDFEHKWNLSQRESEVFELLVLGKKYREIELECKLSEGTVKTHISNIYRKLDVHSKGEMLEMLKQEGRAVSNSGRSKKEAKTRSSLTTRTPQPHCSRERKV